MSAAPVALPVDGYLDAAAARLQGFAGGATDLSQYLVLVSSLPLAAELRAALVRCAGRPLLLPHFDTLRRWAMAAPLPDVPTPLPESERLVLLHSVLAARGGFDERALWGIAGELAALSDELSVAALRLPDSLAALEAQLARAYALRVSQPLAFEARVVFEVWRALAAAGRPDAPSAYRLRLAALAGAARQPLFVLLDGPVAERLSPAEREFLDAWGERAPLFVCAPQPRAAASSDLALLLAAAWPEHDDGDLPPLRARAAALAGRTGASPLAGRLQLVPVDGREAEAQAAAAQVFAWLAEGRQRIALIAEDRLTARRVRALLERAAVLAADETGWKLSTTRAAASVDALLETVAGGAWHADVLDLCKSPHFFADLAGAAKSAAVLELERAIRRHGARTGVAAFRRALAAESANAAGDPVGRELAGAMLDRLERALVVLGGRPAPLPRWLARLQRSLGELAAADSLAADAAGSEIVALVAQRQAELAGSDAVFAFAAFREWLNREFEAAAFRDRSIASPVVFLPRHDARLRRFDAALLVGADASQLAPASPGGSFFSQAVRRELGLPTRAEAETALCRDLEFLLLTVPRVVVTWRREQDGEAQLPAPEIDLLATLHALAWGDDLKRPPLPRPPQRTVDAATAPARPRRAAPVVPLGQVPARLSVSGLASLVACPYRFFARHVLGLNELDEVLDEMEKRDYGALVHRSLERFHAAHPRVSALTPEAALAALTAVVGETFAAAEAENWLALGWRLRWQGRLAAYLDWQRAREAAGFVRQAAEQKVARSLPLPDGTTLELAGRIDRIDAGPAGASLLDYKTQTAQRVRAALADDVQLPAYALLAEPALTVAEAAYVVLDDAEVRALASAGDAAALAEAAAAQRRRLVAAFAEMRAGAPLPAHGVVAVCRHCEARGLCRRDHVDAA